jgi:hypothetical protein
VAGTRSQGLLAGLGHGQRKILTFPTLRRSCTFSSGYDLRGGCLPVYIPRNIRGSGSHKSDVLGLASALSKYACGSKRLSHFKSHKSCYYLPTPKSMRPSQCLSILKFMPMGPTRTVNHAHRRSLRRCDSLCPHQWARRVPW